MEVRSKEPARESRWWFTIGAVFCGFAAAVSLFYFLTAFHVEYRSPQKGLITEYQNSLLFTLFIQLVQFAYLFVRAMGWEIYFDFSIDSGCAKSGKTHAAEKAMMEKFLMAFMCVFAIATLYEASRVNALLAQLR